jgi:hypothetical protein
MLTNRSSKVITVIAILAIALVTLSMASRQTASSPSQSNGSLEQRRGEWTTGYSAHQAYLDQRHGEQMAGPAYDAQVALLEFRQGERATGPSAAAAYLAYRRGEWSGN